MKLNPDCIRDVLRTVEENTDGITPFEYSKDEGSYCSLLSNCAIIFTSQASF